MTNNFLDKMREGGFPLTKWILVACVLVVFADVFKLPVVGWLAFLAPTSLARPWTAVTYPLVMLDVLSLVFYGVTLWWIGASLERSWGTKFYAIYFAIMAILGALFLSAAAFATKTAAPADGWIPLTALLATWCAINSEETVSVWGVVPLLAKWLGVGAIAILFIYFARANPLIGVAAIAPSGVAWWWAKNRAWRDMSAFSSLGSPRASTRTPKKPSRPRDDRPTQKSLNPLERMARAKRKKQFERLMKDD